VPHGDLAQLAAVVGAVGAAALLLARTRLELLAGLAVAAAGEAALAVALIPGHDLRRFVSPATHLAALAFGLFVLAGIAWAFVRWPEAVPVALLAAAPFRISTSVGTQKAYLLDPLYLVLAASVVALVCIRIFGYEDSKAEFLAEDCGLAFQLTNIIRDVKEDASMGRIYIPEEDLARTNLTAANFSSSLLQDPARAQQLRPALEYEAERARKYYESAKWLMELIEEDSRAALWVLVEIYSRLLQKITDRNYDVLTERVRLTLWEKLKVLSRGFLLRIA